MQINCTVRPRNDFDATVGKYRCSDCRALFWKRNLSTNHLKRCPNATIIEEPRRPKKFLNAFTQHLSHPVADAASTIAVSSSVAVSSTPPNTSTAPSSLVNQPWPMYPFIPPSSSLPHGIPSELDADVDLEAVDLLLMLKSRGGKRK